MFKDFAAIITEIVGEAQKLGFPLAGVSFLVAGFQFLTNGDEGFRKARPWLIGGVVGFCIVMACNTMANYFQGKFGF